jgi:hypothetical protein
VVWDFANRISFNIVNEAMVIATIVPEAGAATVPDLRVGSCTTPGGSGPRFVEHQTSCCSEKF